MCQDDGAGRNTRIKPTRSARFARFVEHLTDERVVECTGVDSVVGEPASNTGNAAGCFGQTRNVQCELAEMNRLPLDQTDDNSDPVAQPAPAERGMNGLQFLGETGVYFLAAAHTVPPYWNGVATPRMPQVSTFVFRRPKAL